MRVKSHAEYLQELKDKNISVLPLENYVDSITKILHKCICGNEWYASPNNILRGRKCPECKKKSLQEKHIMSHEDFISKYQRQFNENIKVIGNFTGFKSKIECVCLKCGEEIKVFPDALVHGSGCKKCADKAKGNKMRKSNVFFLKELYDINPNVEIMSKYEGSLSYVKCRCKICGYEWDAIPSNLLKGTGCGRCAKNVKYTDKEFRDKVEQVNPNISLLSQYISSKEYINCKCKICGGKWSTAAGLLISTRHTGCPYCKQSHGEKEIERILKKYSIKYKTQKEYKGLYGVKDRNLSYDFYLPDFNLLIEYQGEQHEHSIDGFVSEEEFEKQIEHDNRKRRFANENSISLLEIWYYDFDCIEDILIKYLNLESVETVMES